MQAHAPIVFDGLLGTIPLRRAVERRIAELKARLDCFTSWRVVVARGTRHGASRFLYSVRIDLQAGGTSITAGRDRGSAAPCDNVCAALEQSFKAAERLLEEHVHRAKNADAGEPCQRDE